MRLGLTFDDVLLVPRRSDVTSRAQVDTHSRLRAASEVAIPIIGAINRLFFSDLPRSRTARLSSWTESLGASCPGAGCANARRRSCMSGSSLAISR